MRMGWEYEGENPEVAFYCGITEMIRDFYLNSSKVTGDSMLCIDGDLFYLGEDCERSLPEAMSERAKKYADIGTYDKSGAFIPQERHDQFDFKLEKLPDAIKPEDAIYGFLVRVVCDGIENPLPSEAKERIHSYVLAMQNYFKSPDGIYKASNNLCEQLTNCHHYQYIVNNVIFLKYDSFMVMLTEGWDA